jgi:protein-tyrosine phosphatase
VFEIVFVCTGNRARSPLAEALCVRYAAGLEVGVRSAGALGLRGIPPLEEAIKAGRALGIDIASHRSVPLAEAGLGVADLVLGFEPFHARAAVEAGASRERVFLLGELVALVAPEEHDGDVVARARETVARADARRALAPTSATATIPDPLGKPAHVMQATAKEIDDLVHRLVAVLFARERV